MDKIYIQDLALRCIIGVFPEERRDKQDVIVNVVLEADLRAAGRSDDLADSVDYKSVKKRIIEIVEGSDFNLVETLAERIAAACLDDSHVDRAVVRVDKPGALRFARSVAVEVDRAKKG
jgi:dihydroneopterin aldolase/D-erythro-7,8-dihydroneopterin triphosphate epimerase